MKALLCALTALALIPAAAQAAETEGDGENIRHLKNIPHTDAPNANTAVNEGTDIEFATITVAGPGSAGDPAAPGKPAAPGSQGNKGASGQKGKRRSRPCKKQRRALRRARTSGKGKAARKRAKHRLRRCKARNRRARTADADPATPGVQKTFAFAGSYYDGIDIIDVTDRANPLKVAHYDCGVAQGDVQVFQRDGRTYLAYADDAYDVFSSQCTRELPGRVFEDGSAAEDGGGAYIIDVTDPYNPTAVSFVPVERGSHNLTVHPSGRYIYNSNSELITSYEPTLEIIDISDLRAPKVAATFPLSTYPGLGTESHDISFNEDGSRAYIAALSHGEILDTTDPLAPKRLSDVLDPAINVWHQAEQIDVGERSYLIAEDEFAGALETGQCPNGAIHVFDITDESAPVKVGAFQIDEVRPTSNIDPGEAYAGRCTAHVFQLHREEQLMVIGWYNAGVRVLDLAELEGYRMGEVGTGGIKQLGYFQFPDTDVWAVKAPTASRDGFHLYANDKLRGFDAYEYAPGSESTSPGRWLTPAQALRGARELRADATGAVRAGGICFLK